MPPPTSEQRQRRTTAPDQKGRLERSHANIEVSCCIQGRRVRPAGTTQPLRRRWRVDVHRSFPTGIPTLRRTRRRHRTDPSRRRRLHLDARRLRSCRTRARSKWGSGSSSVGCSRSVRCRLWCAWCTGRLAFLALVTARPSRTLWRLRSMRPAVLAARLALVLAANVEENKPKRVSV